MSGHHLARLSGVMLLAGLSLSSPARAQEPALVLFDMDTLQFKPGEFTGDDNQKHVAGTAESVPGKLGQAVQFDFVAGARGGFMMAVLPPGEERNKCDGFSFWVKGDGSSDWGGIEPIDRHDFGQRYGYCFPIDSTEWRKIVVPWQDVIPELASPLVNARDGYAPAGFGNFWFGKWFYWQTYPAHHYAIDQIALEPGIEIASAEPQPEQYGLARLRTKLAQHKPVTIVTMGDSLTDEHHWANRQIVWERLLAKAIEGKYGSQVTLVNPAIGGTTLSQNTILMPRWVKTAPAPDLVTVWFGGNDWDSGVRGPRFAEYLRLAVDRIRRQTGGSADILLMTTCPGHARWETTAELEKAVRDVAAEKHTGLADVAAEFRRPGTPDEALKQEYWAWDKVHLGGERARSDERSRAAGDRGGEVKSRGPFERRRQRSGYTDGIRTGETMLVCRS